MLSQWKTTGENGCTASIHEIPEEEKWTGTAAAEGVEEEKYNAVIHGAFYLDPNNIIEIESSSSDSDDDGDFTPRRYWRNNDRSSSSDNSNHDYNSSDDEEEEEEEESSDSEADLSE